MKINQLLLTFSVIVILLGTVLGTMALGLWKTTNTKTPQKYSFGAQAGQYNPADIRGSYTFGEISDLFDIPLGDLAAAFDVKENPAAFQCKEIESAFSAAADTGRPIGVESVRIFVALYKGLPVELDDTVYFPLSAQTVLTKTGKLTAEQADYVSNHLYFSGQISATENVETSPTPIASESSIKGKTTFNEIIAMGVSKSKLETLLGSPITDTSATLKDFCSANGLEFADIRSKVEAMIQ